MKKILLISLFSSIFIRPMNTERNPFEIDLTELTECAADHCACKYYREELPFNDTNQGLDFFLIDEANDTSLRGLQENLIAQKASEKFFDKDELTIAFFGSDIHNLSPRVTIDTIINKSNWENKTINLLYIDPNNAKNIFPSESSLDYLNNTINIKKWVMTS